MSQLEAYISLICKVTAAVYVIISQFISYLYLNWFIFKFMIAQSNIERAQHRILSLGLYRPHQDPNFSFVLMINIHWCRQCGRVIVGEGGGTPAWVLLLLMSEFVYQITYTIFYHCDEHCSSEVMWWHVSKQLPARPRRAILANGVLPDRDYADLTFKVCTNNFIVRANEITWYLWLGKCYSYMAQTMHLLWSVKGSKRTM